MATTSPAQYDFELLLRRTERRAYNLAFRLVGNRADAEDVTQDAYLRAWRKFDSFDRSRSFEGWLFRIITNRVIDLRRRQKRVPILSLDTPTRTPDGDECLAHEIAATDVDPQFIVIESIVDERVQTALAALPTVYRTAIVLCDAQSMSYQEIADFMDCSVGTVRSRIHRARVLARRYLETGEGSYRDAAKSQSPAPRKSNRKYSAGHSPRETVNSRCTTLTMEHRRVHGEGD